MPVALLVGANSPPVIAAIHAGLAAGIRQAQCLVIPGAGHVGPFLQPAVYAAAINHAAIAAKS